MAQEAVAYGLHVALVLRSGIVAQHIIYIVGVRTNERHFHLLRVERQNGAGILQQGHRFAGHVERHVAV